MSPAHALSVLGLNVALFTGINGRWTLPTARTTTPPITASYPVSAYQCDLLVA